MSRVSSSTDSEAALEGLKTTVLPATSAGASSQAAMRKGVPRHDPADEAQRLAQDDVQRAGVEHGRRALVGAHAADEATEVVDTQRQIGAARLADRLAVVERLDAGRVVEVRLDEIGDGQQCP